MVEMGWPWERPMSNAQYYVRNNAGFAYGPTYDLIEARGWATDIGGWVEDENGLAVNFVE